ncbi:hypothetical protein BGX38DRAFT_1240799 [Terfezia claveryi]|nr:hypothetical protein BGX38DRAFT_1240799 [Terfezia claveryi]
MFPMLDTHWRVSMIRVVALYFGVSFYFFNFPCRIVCFFYFLNSFWLILLVSLLVGDRYFGLVFWVCLLLGVVIVSYAMWTVMIYCTFLPMRSLWSRLMFARM